MEPSEAKALLETFYSPVFQIFYDSFSSTEATLKQKSTYPSILQLFNMHSLILINYLIGHRVQREELDAVLNLLEKILLLLPELLQQTRPSLHRLM